MIELKDFTAAIESEVNYAYIIITRSNEVRVIYTSPFTQNTRCATFIQDNDTAYLMDISESDMTVDEQVKYNMFGTDSIAYYSSLIGKLCRRLVDEKEKENQI